MLHISYPVCEVRSDKCEGSAMNWCVIVLHCIACGGTVWQCSDMYCVGDMT
jgi:hypothetical protein